MPEHHNFDQTAALSAEDAARLFARMHSYRHTGAVAAATAALDEAFASRPCRILEVGPGNGEDATRLAGAGHTVVGVDVRTDLVAPDGWTLVEGTAGCLPADDGSFDVVRANRVIHHLADRERFFTEARRVLRPGGRLVLSWPDRSLITTSDPSVDDLLRRQLLEPALVTTNPAVSSQVVTQLREAGFTTDPVRLHTAWVRGSAALTYALPHTEQLLTEAPARAAEWEVQRLRRFVNQLTAGHGWVCVTMGTVTATV